MCRQLLVTGALTIVSAALVSSQGANPLQPVSTQRALLDQYCVTCHNERLKTGNLTLDKFDLARVGDQAEIGEKIVRKLRAGMMPPTGMPRPDQAARDGLITWLEAELDRHGVAHVPAPGLHRLNRAEYANAIRDVLGLQVDATKFLPSDDSTHGFDNMAGTLVMSPALMEAYLSAAGKISRLAIGGATAATQAVYEVPEGATQNYHVEGLPFGSRGGVLIKHEFPADGEYVFKIAPVIGYSQNVFGQVTGEQLEISVDGARVQLIDWDKEVAIEGRWFTSVPIPITAGLHSVGVTFIATNYSPGQDLNNPFLRITNAPGRIPGFTFYPHVGRVWIDGPFDARGATDTPSRRRIFVCRPASDREEETCARTILSTLARRAFRRPVAAEDVGSLMAFYEAGRSQGNFDNGIEVAIGRLLSDPEFIYRHEPEPARVAPGRSYRVTDVALASRLSFFLWSSVPDDELIALAAQQKLRDAAVLERQVRRMLADPRSKALVDNFTGQWLNVRGMQAAEPVVNIFPDFDDNLRQALRRETELFFASIVNEDRSVLDLLDADYTFVDERLAIHYGIPNVYGSQFRRVTLGPELDMRRGLLGKGALLTVTSQAARTSPVSRGKWFLQTFLGVSPPDPPPNVPAVPEKKDDSTGNLREPTMRQRMEEHRRNPVCASCHRIFEPFGIALENFDAVGAWRIDESGIPIDPSGQIVDGTAVDGPASLRRVLRGYSDQFVRVVTEKLLTYGLGRGIEYRDMPLVRSIVRDGARDNYRFSSIILGIVNSQPFLMNMKEENLSAQAVR